MAESDSLGAVAIRLLVVEDSPTDVALLELALKQARVAKFELVVESRVADACTRLRSEAFDLVMTDLGLPDGFGIDTYRMIRGAAQGVPIIVLTGDDDDEKGRLALHEGAQDYLVKGRLSPHALARAARYAMDKKHQDELRQAQRFEAVGQLKGDVAQDLDDVVEAERPIGPRVARP